MRQRNGILIGLLVAVAVINYIDRGSLSVAAPAIAAEMRLDPERMGVLLSAFFWSYAAMQFLAGWLADRFSVIWVLAGGLVIWSAATLSTGLTGGLAALLVCRVVLGAGESVAFPCYSKVIAGNFPSERRGVPNSLIEAATKLGPALGTLLGGILLAHHGWRTLFLVLGAGSLLWLGPWLAWAPRGAGSQAGRARFPRRMANRGCARCMGHVYRQCLLYVRLLLPAHLAAVLLSAGASSFHAGYGRVGFDSVFRGGGRGHRLRLALRCVDPPRRIAHPRAQDLRSVGIPALDGDGRRAHSVRFAHVHAAPLRRLYRLRHSGIEPLGDYADAGGSRSGRHVDRDAEYHRQPLRNCRRRSSPA